MPSTFAFDTTSPRFGLPLLFAGQSQKEVFVNEALSLIDTLLHCAVEGVAITPPAIAADGENWLVGGTPAGDWEGQANSIACRKAGGWLFVMPQDGMRILDRSTGQELRYWGAWKIPPAPVEPNGGSNVDAEARTAIIDLIAVLRTSGVLPTI